MIDLRHFLHIQLGLRKKTNFSEKLREIYVRTFSEAPPQYSARIVQVHPRANFAQSHHMFGCPRTSCAQILWDLSGMPRAQAFHRSLGHMTCSHNPPLFRVNECLSMIDLCFPFRATGPNTPRSVDFTSIF